MRDNYKAKNKAVLKVVNYNPPTYADKCHSIYNKYAAIMYGNILHITKDEVLAELIFAGLFDKIIKDRVFSSTPACNKSLYACMAAKEYTAFCLKDSMPCDGILVTPLVAKLLERNSNNRY